MERRSRFLAGALAAALTFGGLMAFVGPEHFGRHGSHHGWSHHENWQGNEGKHGHCGKSSPDDKSGQESETPPTEKETH